MRNQTEVRCLKQVQLALKHEKKDLQRQCNTLLDVVEPQQKSILLLRSKLLQYEAV
jgi:hypothetical protein